MKQLYFFIAFLSFANHSFGQVGINTTTPYAQLEIKSSNQATPANTDGIMIPKVDAFPAINPTAAQDGMMVYLTQNIGINLAGFYYWKNATSSWIKINGITTEMDPKVGSTTSNKVPKWNGSNLIDGLIFDNGTNVGIGTSNPQSKMEIVGPDNPLELKLSSTSGFGASRLSFISDKDTNNEWRPAYIESGDNATGAFWGRLDFYTNGVGAGNKFGALRAMSISNGNLGIGYTNPTDKLEVAGKTKTTNLQMTTGATANYVLQSDAAGNATWVNPTILAIPESDPQVSSATNNTIPKWNGTTLVDGIVFDNGTNIGIGTNNPLSKLEITTAGTTDLRISSSGAFGPSRLSMISDKNLTNEWRPGFIESADNGSFTGRLDFYTNGTGVGNKFGSVIAMSAVNGNVGVGTTNPNKAKLEVSGFVANAPQSCFAFYARSGACIGSAATGVANDVSNYSIYASDRIMASEFNAFSDKRIKNNFNASNPATDLAILNKLKVTDYNHIDTANKGTDAKKGFIAQEVKEVFPEAVSQTKEFIPNVYQVAKSSILKGTNLLVTLDKNHDLKVGDKVRLIADKQADYTITKTYENTFEVENYDQTKRSVFVFGKEVSDFHVVDYDRIFTLGISAMQQLTKENETQKLEIESLKKELKNTTNEILKRLEKLEKTSNELKKL